jgi:nucleoside-diphosphate-sugar epimerase
VLFGPEDILINNIAWTPRYFPLFAVFGDGRYHVQPIYVDDLAELAILRLGRTAQGYARQALPQRDAAQTGQERGILME